MGKVINYLGFIVVLIILFNMAGIIVESPTGYLLGFISDPSSWSTSTFFLKIAAVLAAAGVAGVTVSFFYKGDISLIVKVPMAIFLISIGWDIVGIYDLLAVVNSSLALLLIAPLVIAYGISVIEWWSGSST